MATEYMGELGLRRVVEDLAYRIAKLADTTIELSTEEIETLNKLLKVHELYLNQKREHEAEIEEMKNAQEHLDWETAEELETATALLESKEEEIKDLKKERATLRSKVTRLEKKVANLQ